MANAIIRLVGAMMIEPNDEWPLQPMQRRRQAAIAHLVNSPLEFWPQLSRRV